MNNPKIKEHEVVRIYDLFGNYEVVAPSIEAFFLKFLDKIAVVLERHQEDKSIMSIDDDLLPSEVNSWT